MGISTASLVSRLPPELRERFLNLLTPEQREALQYEWSFWARPEQLPPTTNPNHPAGRWRTWLVLPGRGWGKTLSGAQWVRGEIESGRRRMIGLVGPTEDDVRHTMIEGPTGILSVCPPNFRPTFEPANRRLVWPNGGVARMFSAEKPSSLRGPNLDGAWSDEICAWGGGSEDKMGDDRRGSNQRATQTYDMLQFALRQKTPSGIPVQEIITSTPKPLPLLRTIMRNPLTVI